jgi:hypothetical protein
MGDVGKHVRGLQGRTACNCNTKNDVELVAKMMRAIEQHNESKAITPCPACLRDTMLLIAALAHFESTVSTIKAPIGKCLSERFAERAYERIETALTVLLTRVEIPHAAKH